MKITDQEKKYALETTGLFVSGLGMMLLVLVSAWSMAVLVSGNTFAKENGVGDRSSLSDTIASAALSAGDEGRVAGAVDDSTIEEQAFRNDASEWLSAARRSGDNSNAYRDGILDRNAQNHARSLADACSADIYNSWEETIGTAINEGYVASFGEAAFAVSGEAFASEMLLKETDYQRLFADVDAYGVGVAQTTEISGCEIPFVLVFHLATIK